MPDRSLFPQHNPPTLYERVLYHPWELVVAACCVAIGALLLWALAIGNQIAAPISDLPIWLAMAVPALVGWGGFAVLVALTWRGRHVSTEWLIERFGWGATALGWGIYGVTVIDRWPSSLWTITLCLMFVAGSIGRLWAVHTLARRTREAVEEVEGDLEHGGQA